MEAPSPHFVRRVLLGNALLLIAVLAVVGLASGAIYNSMHNQVLDQAKSRQLLLADQTARGIESYYQTIFENLDLVRRAENEEGANATERPGEQSADHASAAAPPAGQSDPLSEPAPRWRGGNGFNAARRPTQAEGQSQFAPPGRGGFGVGAPLPGSPALPSASQRSLMASRISQILWRQLQGRVATLFWVNNASPAPTSASHPAPGETSPAPARRSPLVQLIGRADNAPQALDVQTREHDWLAAVRQPSISHFEQYPNLGSEFGGAGGANLIAIPYPRDRLLVAVVPIRPVQDKFLRTLHDGLNTDALLIDPDLTVMAGTRPAAAGASLRAITDPDARAMAIDSVHQSVMGSQIRMRSFDIGRVHFVPSLVSAGSLVVADAKWELLIASPISSVDQIVASLLHRALLWGAFVVASVGCILVSTAWQLIRIRTRLERVRHDVLKRELEQARQIQLAWLPALPPQRRHGPGVPDRPPLPDVAAINIPANHISGDFYNWFELPDGRLVVTVGDVTGHGISAAFLMATTQLLVRNTLPRVNDPARCLEEVNEQLCVQVFNGQFVTMLILVLDLAGGYLDIACAGHPAPLLADGKSFQPLPIESQLVLGVERSCTYATQRCPLPPGSSLLLYTDGVVDCLSSTGARFGAEDLRRALYGRYPRAQAMLDAVAARLTTFRANCELTDDLTLVAIQLPPIPAPHPARSPTTTARAVLVQP
jgi:serine phosphatase RsbU (regulator of sigma subunit)